MSQPMIILYDVPSTIPQPWAPNVWRIRLILNYKRLPYRTCWVEFPDIEPTLRAINAPPSSYRPDGQPVYTLPAILDPGPLSNVSNSSNAYYVSDPSSSSSGSLPHPVSPVVLTHANTIAEYLERAYPARPVIPDGARALQTFFVHYVTEVFVQPLLPIMVPLSHQRLPSHIQGHFRTAIEGLGGAISQEDELSGGIGVGGQQRQQQQQQQQQQQHAAVQRREEQWEAVHGRFSFLSGILDRNGGPAGDGDGVVVMGHDLTYADFALCSVLIWIEKVAPHEGWARVREWDGGRWGRLWERCQPYMDVF